MRNNVQPCISDNQKRLERNLVFASNSDFLTPISFILDISNYEFGYRSNNLILKYQTAQPGYKDIGIINLSLGQRLKSLIKHLHLKLKNEPEKCKHKIQSKPGPSALFAILKDRTFCNIQR